MSIIQRFYKHVSQTPEKIAVICDEQTLSYRELSDQVALLSEGLSDLGCKRGDHVAVLLPNGVEFAVVMLAAANMGIVLVPNNMTLGTEALQRSMQAADVKHAIIWHALIPDLKGLFEQILSEDALLVSVGGESPGTHAYASLIKTSIEKNPLQSRRSTEEQPYILTMTSGSTGDPKPIVLSQETKLLRAQAAIGLYNITSEDLTLIATPMYHSLAERLVVISLISGGTCVVLGTYTAKKWIDAVIDHKVSFAIPVSSQLKQILIELKNKPSPLETLRCIVSSSERLPDAVREEMKQVIRCDVHECYGASEVAIVTDLDCQSSENGSVGKVIPGVEIAILDDNRVPVGVNQAGEIACKTPMLFSGYYKNPETTAAAMWNDFFCTGDIGCIDEEGYLYFLGRKKDVIISGGINIYPKDIEDVLNSHESVVESAVIPLLDDALGEKLTAVVVVNSNTPFNIRLLQRLCAKALADYQQPRAYLVVESLPKNPMGKIMKQNLIQQITDSSAFA